MRLRYFILKDPSPQYYAYLRISNKPGTAVKRYKLLRKDWLDHKAKAPPDMPPVRTARNRKPPPDGFEDLEDTLLEFSNKMKDAENAPHEGKKRHEVLWPVFQINHQRTLAVVLST